MELLWPGSTGSNVSLAISLGYFLLDAFVVAWFLPAVCFPLRPSFFAPDTHLFETLFSQNPSTSCLPKIDWNKSSLDEIWLGQHVSMPLLVSSPNLIHLGRLVWILWGHTSTAVPLVFWAFPRNLIRSFGNLHVLSAMSSYIRKEGIWSGEWFS